MQFTLSTATTSGKANNTSYPNQVLVNSANALQTAVSFDHVCGTFENQQRSIYNFRVADCLVMDCDNDHSEDPAAWIRPESLKNYFENVAYAVTFSRNHMRVKHGKAARPKFHIYFPIHPIKDAKVYADLKREIQSYFPYFDNNALDAARFVFGVNQTQVEWHAGSMTVDQLMMSQRFFAQSSNHEIPEGKRNATLSHFAGRVIMRLGPTNEAYQAFLDEAAKCDPPLPDKELNSIWQSALKFGQRMAKQPGYISPAKYNQPDDNLKPADYSDTGETYAFVNCCKQRVCYTSQSGLMWFDGKIWQESEPLALGEVQRFTDKQLADAQLRVTQAKKIIDKNGVGDLLASLGRTKAIRKLDDDQRKSFAEYEQALKYEAFVLKERSVRGISGILNNARPLINRQLNEFDADPFLLNTPAGPFNLKKGLHGKQEIKASERLGKN